MFSFSRELCGCGIQWLLCGWWLLWFTSWLSVWCPLPRDWRLLLWHRHNMSQYVYSQISFSNNNSKGSHRAIDHTHRSLSLLSVSLVMFCFFHQQPSSYRWNRWVESVVLRINHECLNSAEEQYSLFVANGEYIHEIVFEGGETTTFSGDVFDSATGLDFLYKYVLILHYLFNWSHRSSSVGFWSDTTQDKIYCATLNGTDVEELINSSILAVGKYCTFVQLHKCLILHLNRWSCCWLDIKQAVLDWCCVGKDWSAGSGDLLPCRDPPHWSKHSPQSHCYRPRFKVHTDT